MEKSMGIIEWLNTYNGVIIGIATVVLVGITGIYAYNAILMKESRLLILDPFSHQLE